MFFSFKVKKFISISLLSLLVAGCLGDGDGYSVTTLQGTAAIGAPVVNGTVDVKCVGGGNLQTTTDASGAWTVTLSEQTLPCALRVEGGTLGTGVAFHSLAIALGVTNITPLTDVVVANLTGSDPSSWFLNLSASDLSSINATSLSSAISHVKSAFNLTALDGINPLSDAFRAVAGDTIDDILEAMTATGQSHASLLTAAQSQDFVNQLQSFASSLATQYAAIASAGGTGTEGTGGQSGGTGGTQVTSCASGETLLSYTGAATGSLTNGANVCFTHVSATSLVLGSVSLNNPTRNETVQAPYSGYVFEDSTNQLLYEVVFENNNLKEIVLTSSPSQFLGTFSPPTPSATESSVAELIASFQAVQCVKGSDLSIFGVTTTMYGSCKSSVVADFSFSFGDCSVSKSGGVVTFQQGASTITASLSGDSADGVQTGSGSSGIESFQLLASDTSGLVKTITLITTASSVVSASATINTSNFTCTPTN